MVKEAYAASRPRRFKKLNLDDVNRLRDMDGDAWMRVFDNAHYSLTRLRVPVNNVEDLAQEVVVKVIKGLNQYDSKKSDINTWICSITNRVLIDYAPRQNCRIRAWPLDYSLNANGVSEEMEFDDRDALAEAISSCPRKVWEVAFQYHAVGRSVKDISSSLEIPSGTVKSTLYRFRARLSDTL